MQQDLSDDENNEDDAESFSQDFSCQTSGSNSDYININSVDTDAEAQSRPAGQRQQQRPQSFYKQPPCVLSPAAAFEHLVKFVQQLPAHIVSDKAAAHLRTFASRKVWLLQLHVIGCVSFCTACLVLFTWCWAVATEEGA